MKKTIVAVAAAGLLVAAVALLAGCVAQHESAATAVSAGSMFALVLADSGEVLLTEIDVEAYHSDNGTLELNKSGIEKWNSHLTYQSVPKLADSLFSREFTIQIEGKEICRGKFWSNLSSASVSGVVILDSLFKLDTERNFIWLKSSYPWDNALDPSINSEMARVFKE